MATPRLPLLWPMLSKPPRLRRVGRRVTTINIRPHPSSYSRPCRCIATTGNRHEESNTKRYGTAQEPAPHLREQKSTTVSSVEASDVADKTSEEVPQEEHEEEDIPVPTKLPTTPSKISAIDEGELAVPPLKPPKPPDVKPLDSVLHMPSPEEEEKSKPPHLKTPPYVHHFDTYGLVRALTKSNYTPIQSATLMKAVRGMLISNMELARDGLVSKSNVENETYLFRAACSELKTEIGNSRKSQIERMRTERAQLQHEVDILGQRLGQETGNLKDEMKGLFDDRKMAVRQEQRLMETKIQELGYKITVALNSDARSEVESLRWVLTRRAAITIGISAFMLFVALRYTSYVAHQQQLEDRKKNSPTSEQGPSEGGLPLLAPTGETGQQGPMVGELLASGGASLG